MAVGRIRLVLAGVVVVLLAWTGFVLVRRIAFPWDYYAWSESPFLTNLWKLHVGQPLYETPERASSYVYSPGLEWITFALLRPLGRDLDLVACRIVSVALGIAAAVVAARSSSRLAGEVRSYMVFAAAAYVLLLAQSFTFDICHPDNLLLAHASVSFALTLRALGTNQEKDARLAVAWAALGVFAKQTAAAGWIGVALALESRAVRRGRATVVGVAVFGAALTLLLVGPYKTFFVLEVLSRHPVDLGKVKDLLRDVVLTPHRALVLLAAVLALVRLARARRDQAVRAYLLAWAALGFEVVPSLLAYFKVPGVWNNLGVIVLWLALVVIPVLWETVRRPLAAALLLAVVGLAYPKMRSPVAGEYAFAERLEACLREDVRAGRRVLLPHGTSALIRAGVREPPIDRANTVFELDLAGLGGLAGTRGRIERQEYDRVYLFVAVYGRDVLDAIERRYREVDVLPGDGLPRLSDEHTIGFQGFMHDPVRILAPRD
jgi:hypothetical protein